jgi:hypothetical protein
VRRWAELDEKDKAVEVHWVAVAVTRKEYFLMVVAELRTEMAIWGKVDLALKNVEKVQ